MSSQNSMPPDIATPAFGTGTERSRHERLPYRTEIHYGAEDLEPAAGVDLSFGGVGFIAPQVVKIGAEVEIAFLDRSVAVRGIVRNLQQMAAGYRVGVQFHADEREVVDVVLRYYS
jgi:hypothetical protein